tara:strand:+ start:25311 stop:25988 length:678 start_codon:yes stop_codon:yes gene_type:complete
MIPGVAEYLDVNPQTDLLLDLYKQVKGIDVGVDFNVFGKTPFESYSLEYNMTGKPTGYEQVYEPILSQHRKVHPHYQFRSTGFNTANSTDKDVFPHTDVDFDLEYSQGYNIVIPVLGMSRLDYYETREEEVWLPEKNAHGYAYYHEFKCQAYDENLIARPSFEKFLAERKIGEIIIDRPILIDTEIMHRVVITEAPRCAFVTRWNNIPPELSNFHTFKERVESIL